MIVTFAYYNDAYYGATIEETEFNRLNLRAEDDIDNLSSKDITDLETWEETPVKKAICSQIEYYFLNGDTYNESAAGSEGIGKYNYSLGTAKDPSSSNIVLSPRTKNYLGKTNLLYRGINQRAYCE